MEITVLIVISVLAAGFAIALGRYVWPAIRGSDREALAKNQAAVAALDQECRALRGRAAELDEDRKTAIEEAKKSGEEVARLTERAAGLTKQVEDLARQSGVLEAQRDVVASEVKAAAAEVARLTERESALTQKIESQAAQLSGLQKELTAEFENIATRILRVNASELSENSHKALATILEALRERIQEFQKKVESAYENESRDVLSLKEQIRLVVETSHAIGSQADSLAKALRGDSQLLGRWGELALERILEVAGLTEGREYISQGRGLGLRNEDGRAQKPDIVVMLPEDRTMIVDSKVPLASYERLIAARDENERARCAD